MITNITIKNIKGYGEPATSINLELKTNRVNIIYAPNGTGKSSLATAFNSLEGGKLTLSKDEMYHKDETLSPELQIVMDGVTYKADRNSDTISPVLIPYVINSGTIVSTTQQNIGGRYTKVSGYLDIENIVVIDKVPPVVIPLYKISEIRNHFGVNRKILENRAILFTNPSFLKACESVGHGLDTFLAAQSRQRLIDDIKSKIQSIIGTTEYVKNCIQDAWFDDLENNPAYSEIMQGLDEFTVGMSRLDRFDLFYQVLYFWTHTKQDIKKANKRTDYNEVREKFDANLALLDTTWKSIQSVEEDGKLVVHFPHADEISNGQRDILTFVVELLKFKSKIQNGKKYLLIIDEVFDYLDDANTITAQYFLTKFLELNKGNMYLCMFTHLNPFSFKNYIFSDKKVNFVYLQSTLPVATNEMKAFIAFRSELAAEEDPAKKDLYEKLSHDLFHYNPITVDYSILISTHRNNNNIIPSWGKTGELHQVLINEVNKYLSGAPKYDPYAVAMALRLRVEKVVYGMLSTQEKKDDFVNQKMTKYKFAYAEDNGVSIPEVLYIVNAIHNEADHLKYDQVKHEYLEKSMVYKLQNNVIMGIIKQIFEWDNHPLTTDAID